jgi:uncharacterized small protein (DUF1192 family)
MDIDELDPRKPNSKPKDLSAYSIEDLEGYVKMLKAEIARAEGEIKRKGTHMQAASAFFKREEPQKE